MGGLSTAWILAALVLALVTVGVLVSLDPSRARRQLRRVGPRAFIAVVIAAPLVAWTASAGGDKKSQSLIVERAIGLDGAPELIVSLGDAGLNKLGLTNGKRFVRVECVGRSGESVLSARQRWPFIDEVGYDYPHVHQQASREEVQRADRCRLRGPHVPLAADVKGVLKR